MVDAKLKSGLSALPNSTETLNNIFAYFRQSFRLDFVAGLTVAMIAVPQSMAYAAIAGINPIYGLYTSIVPAIIAAIFGSSNYLVTGPSNATALATAGVLLAVSNRPDFVEFVFALAILSGLIKLLMGVLQLGSITRYISNSVLTGFLAGVGLLIIVNQLGSMLGLPKGDGTVDILVNLALHVGQINPFVMATGLITILVLFLARRINKDLPSALVAIFAASLFVHVTGWDQHGVQLVQGLNNLGQSGPTFHMPQLELKDLYLLFSSAGALALFSLVEAVSVARAISLNTGEHFNPSREFIGQGLASILGGFFQAMPSSGSPSRSAVNVNTGARTRWAAAFSGLLVLAAVILFSGLISYIPVAGLAGVIIFSAFQMIDWHHIRLTWHSRAVSRIVLLVTFFSTLLLPIHLAIYLGGMLSILIYLNESSKLDITYLKVTQEGEFVEYDLDGLLAERPTIAIANVEGALYFGAIDDLEWHMEEVFQSGAKVVILRMRHTHLLASTGVTTLESLIKRAHKAGVRIIVSGLSEDMEGTLKTSGVEDLIGPRCTFLATHTLFESTQQALCCAKEMLLQDPK